MDQTNLAVSRKQVVTNMKFDFHMSYEKIKKIPFKGNSERCKVLRFLYPQKMLQLLHDVYRCVNIEQTWICESDFRHHKWAFKGTTNSNPIKLLGY